MSLPGEQETGFSSLPLHCLSLLLCPLRSGQSSAKDGAHAPPRLVDFPLGPWFAWPGGLHLRHARPRVRDGYTKPLCSARNTERAVGGHLDCMTVTSLADFRISHVRHDSMELNQKRKKRNHSFPTLVGRLFPICGS